MIEVSHISVIGYIWQPTEYPCAMDYTLNTFDIEQMVGADRTVTRGTVEDWLSGHAGDFREVKDFAAIIGYDGTTYEIGWADEESECTYSDCMRRSEHE